MMAFMQRNESHFLPNGAMRAPDLSFLYPSYKAHPHLIVFVNGEIGFATLPEQVHRKSVKKGFDFTLIVVAVNVLDIRVIQIKAALVRLLLLPIR
ncbi:UNVERIFIED_CONTAM: Sept5 [Trichonephila clavipes]